MNDVPVFKILTPPQWALWRELGVTWGSPDDRRDGFIHFSAAHQLLGTLGKHFAVNPLVWLVRAPQNRLGAALRWEPSRAGQDFPHLYAPLHLHAADGEWPLRQAQGQWTLPREVAR